MTPPAFSAALITTPKFMHTHIVMSTELAVAAIADPTGGCQEHRSKTQDNQQNLRHENKNEV